MLQPGSFRDRPNRRPQLCPWGQPQLRCSSPGDAAQGTHRPPHGGRGAGGAPTPHLQPADSKSGLAGGPGAAERTRPAGLRAASVST